MTWVVRLLRNIVIATVLIGLAQWLKGREIGYAVEFSLFWGVLSATLFTGTRYYKWRKGQACAVCETDGSGNDAGDEVK